MEAARALFRKLLAVRNCVGLLSEDVDPATGHAVGKLPADLQHGRDHHHRYASKQALGGRGLSRLVNVSNRVALPGARADGGLAVGLLAAMQASGGLWFGWNGTAYADNSAPPNPSLQQRGNVSFATIPLPETALGRYYNGFANGTLWPLFHYFLDSFRYDPEQYAAYCHVNALFAAGLQPLLRPDDLVWVHDYHLIPLAEELHARGARVPIGFFLHIPFPNFEVLRALPVYRELLGQLLAFDLLGFQTERDRRGFLDGVLAAGIADGTDASGRILTGSRRISTGVFPIGVDAQAIARVAEKSTASTSVRDITLSLHGRRLIIGVDRLDYSKGLLERFDAYQKFLEKFPQFQGAVTYLQIAPLGRQNVTAYRRIRTALEQNAGRTNGDLATSTGPRSATSTVIFRTPPCSGSCVSRRSA